MNTVYLLYILEKEKRIQRLVRSISKIHRINKISEIKNNHSQIIAKQREREKKLRFPRFLLFLSIFVIATNVMRC